MDNKSFKLLKHLTEAAHKISHGKKPSPEKIFELTKEEIYPREITELAESFGMMLVKVEAREFRLKQTIRELERLNRELQMAKAALDNENKSLKRNLKRKFSPREILCKNSKMQNIISMVERIADTPLNVLITGETGTGKELIAKVIHYNSSRANKGFVALNCAALPESLLESELFGIEKGVATGVEKRIGRIEQANGGTLFLDEIGDMPLSSQAKILRVLEERKVERIGGRKHIPVDIRIIAATNKDLKAEAKQGNFREDLYYRLNVVQIRIPPLRERKDDIPLLAAFFLDDYCGRFGRRRLRFSSDALKCLENYNWPGNVRELRNEIERCVALAGSDTIYRSDLSDEIKNFAKNKSNEMNSQGNSPAENQELWIESCRLEDLERKLIIKVLEETGGNKSEASRKLGISREGLRRKLKRHGL